MCITSLISTPVPPEYKYEISLKSAFVSGVSGAAAGSFVPVIGSIAGFFGGMGVYGFLDAANYNSNFSMETNELFSVYLEKITQELKTRKLNVVEILLRWCVVE